jgi:hypothetical protein
MRRSASTAPESETTLNALLLIGSIRFVMRFIDIWERRQLHLRLVHLPLLGPRQESGNSLSPPGRLAFTLANRHPETLLPSQSSETHVETNASRCRGYRQLRLHSHPPTATRVSAGNVDIAAARNTATLNRHLNVPAGARAQTVAVRISYLDSEWPIGEGNGLRRTNLKLGSP